MPMPPRAIAPAIVGALTCGSGAAISAIIAAASSVTPTHTQNTLAPIETSCAPRVAMFDSANANPALNANQSASLWGQGQPAAGFQSMTIAPALATNRLASAFAVMGSPSNTRPMTVAQSGDK